MKAGRRNVIPGFGLTMGYTVAYLSLIALIPLSTIFLKTAGMDWTRFIGVILSSRVVAAYRLSIGASLIGAGVNSVFGFAVAWTLVRYQFPAKALIDSLVDLPFALPTSVAGITLTAIYSENGWIGRLLAPLGIKVAFTRLGVIVALTFIGLPFVVRTVQPVLEDIDRERLALADFPARACAGADAGRAHGLRARLRPRARRIWLCGLHFRQHADADRSGPAAYHDQARAVRLSRRNRHRARDAGAIVRDAVSDQSAAALELTLRCCRISAS